MDTKVIENNEALKRHGVKPTYKEGQGIPVPENELRLHYGWRSFSRRQQTLESRWYGWEDAGSYRR